MYKCLLVLFLASLSQKIVSNNMLVVGRFGVNGIPLWNLSSVYCDLLVRVFILYKLESQMSLSYSK